VSIATTAVGSDEALQGQFIRLTALLFLVGLTASRVGVVLHELGGHYGVARSFGCSLTELRLFLFGGGWVNYDCRALTSAQELATDLGGIAIELAAGALLGLGVARFVRAPLARLLVAGMGALFVLHGLFYLVTGVHYGVGDGRMLHGMLAGRRGGWVAAGSALLVALCFALVRRLAATLSPWIPAGPALLRVALATAAILLAAALHAIGFAAEQRVLAEPTYAATFRPQAEIAVEQELRRFEVERPRTGPEVAAQRRALEAEHAVFPLRPVLAVLLAIATFAGLFVALRGADADDARWAARGTLARAALVCAIAQGVVIALDRLF
jgi:hypothetical protein